MLAGLPALLLISIHGVGHDQIDLADARRKGVMVINTPDVLTDDVADLAVGLIIALLRKIPPADSHVRVGAWQRQEFPLGRRVSGRRFGILGFGRIGRAIAARLTAFGPVGYTSRRPKDVALAWHGDVLALARASDVMIVACPATIETIGLVDSTVLDALGPGGYLINVARGAVIDEQAMIEALREGRLAGAGLDVFETEPHGPDALTAFPNVVLTPHIGGHTADSHLAMQDCVLVNLEAAFNGKPLPYPVTSGS
jgi:lactate dehydrogenase-like 2-hydroxyacid dehydrogenase